MCMSICQTPRIGEIWLPIDLPRFHSFLLPLGKFEKIGIFGKKKVAQSLLCMVNMFKISEHIFSENFRFFDRMGTSLRTQKEVWLNAKEARHDHVPQNRSNRSFGFQIGQIGLWSKFVHLWKTLGMAKLPSRIPTSFVLTLRVHHPPEKSENMTWTHNWDSNGQKWAS